MKAKYDSDLIINTAKFSDGRNVIDLNLLSLDGFLSKESNINRSISGVNKIFFDENKKHFSTVLYENSKLVANFLNSYAQAGRRTIFNGLKDFFELQVEKNRHLRDPNTIQDYCRILQSRIYSRTIGKSHATSRLCAVNKFLVFTDDIHSEYKYEFLNKKYKAGNDAYTKTELSMLVQVNYLIFDATSKVIEEHIARSKSGFRDFPLGQVISIEEAKLSNPKITIDYIVRNPLYWFMHSSFILFCIYTWSNEKQICESNLEDFKLKDNEVESKLLYKGRAHSFIRLNIGSSTFEGERTGIGFYKKFILIRNIIWNYLIKSNYLIDHNALLFMTNPKDNEVRRFFPSLRSFQNHPVVKSINKSGLQFPNLSSRRIRKTVEQLADSEIKNPFITLNKAQHSWETYRKSYAQGNHEEARKAMSAALNILTSSSIDDKTFNERQTIAQRYDINIVKKDILKHQIHGLACTDVNGNSQETKMFKRKQLKNNRSPKICSDFSNCINCSNCAVVEDEDAIYHLLSFQYMIDYNKVIYIGSSKASQNYSLMISKIDFMLRFIDKKTLARARKRLQLEGVSDIWKS
ncbi:hypothetical protein [Vibrio hyugaensis]|uniref:hypothetical protein n=1 Tax=Vibrio hyugaensis TaxID=1534743 RepID=UPI0005F05300|nr:hypothetical protein [Vibrio hyugaensis]